MDLAAIWSLAILLGVALALHLTPRLTRPEVFFGVTVPQDFRDSPAGRGLTRMYRGLIWGATAIALAVVFAGRGRNPGVVMGAACWWLTVGGSLCWLWMNRLARRHAVAPSSQREAALEPTREKLPGN